MSSLKTFICPCLSPGQQPPVSTEVRTVIYLWAQSSSSLIVKKVNTRSSVLLLIFKVHPLHTFWKMQKGEKVCSKLAFTMQDAMGLQWRESNPGQEAFQDLWPHFTSNYHVQTELLETMSMG